MRRPEQVSFLLPTHLRPLPHPLPALLSLTQLIFILEIEGALEEDVNKLYEMGEELGKCAPLPPDRWPVST